MIAHSFPIILLSIVSIFIGLILCFFGYKLDRYLTTLLRRQDNFYNSIVHNTFPGTKIKTLDLSLIPKLIYMLFWLIISGLIQGCGHIIKILVMVLFFVYLDFIASASLDLPSFFSLPGIYAIGILILISILFVIVEMYHPSFTKHFVMIITAFTGSLIALAVLIYIGDNSFNPLSKDIVNKEFIKSHFTYSIITIWIALGLFGIFVQYKEDKASAVSDERIEWADNWPDK